MFYREYQNSLYLDEALRSCVLLTLSVSSLSVVIHPSTRGRLERATPRYEVVSRGRHSCLVVVHLVGRVVRPTSEGERQVLGPRLRRHLALVLAAAQHQGRPDVTRYVIGCRLAQKRKQVQHACR